MDCPVSAHCTIPDAMRLPVATMQLIFRSMFEEAFTLEDGSYAKYLDFLHKNKRWPIDQTLPKPQKIALNATSLQTAMDIHIHSLALPEETREWYRALYISMFNHAERAVSCAALFPNPKELFQSWTEKDPLGNVQILYGPHALHVRCERDEDFSQLVLSKNGSQEERNEARNYVGMHMVRELPKKLGGSISISVENYSKSVFEDQRMDTTLIHELEHANNCFYRSKNTYIDPPHASETEIQRCARMGIAFDIKEECIAWCRHQNTFAYLFLEEDPSYKLIEKKERVLNEMNAEPRLIKDFKINAAVYLRHIVPVTENAVQKLLSRFTSKLVSELLRPHPLSQWPDLADKLTANHF